MEFTSADVLDAIARGDDRARMTFRALVRRSLYAYTKIVVCYNEPRNLMAVDTFKERSDWIQWVITEKKRGLLEDPRSYIKSTSNSRSIPGWIAIQRAHADYDHPSEVERAERFLAKYPHIQGVDNRILLICDSKESAARFGGSVKQIIETNPVFIGLFPELVWPNTRRLAYGSFTDEEFCLPGRVRPDAPDQFFRAAGIETKVVGGRADVVVFNDLVGDHNWRSVAEIDKRRRYLSTAPALLADRDPTSPHGGVIMVEGNRWSLDDMNSRIHDEFHDWAIWRRSVYKCYVHGTGNCGRWGSDTTTECAPTQESLWPERYADAEALARLERDVADPEVWAAQYLNDPTSASELNEANYVPFTLEMRPYKTATGIERGWCAVIDSDGKQEVIPIATMSPHLISVDPASSDDPKAARFAISWYARDAETSRRFWLDCRADRWGPDESMRQLVAMLADATEKLGGRTPRVLVEKVAAQVYVASALMPLLHEYNRRAKTPILLREVEMIPRRRGDDKWGRILNRVGLVLNQRLIHLRSGLQLPRTETRHAPTGTLDTLDTIAQAEEIIMGIHRSVDTERQREVRRRRREVRANRAGRTGIMPF